MPTYLQYGKELFASWSSHTPLTGLPEPNHYPIDHLWDTSIERLLVEQWQRISQGGVHTCIPRLLRMRKRLIECINKVGGHTRYDLQYIHCNHKMVIAIRIFNKDGELRWPSFY